MEDRRERDVIGPIPYRITQGHHHREEEEAFDDKTFDECKRDHMVLGNNVVQGVGASFEDLLQSLQTISKKYPTIKIKPIHNLQNITLHPFHLVNVMQRRHHFGQNTQQNGTQTLPDPVANEEVQKALRWLSHNCNWKPILAWDSMMCDVFPANLEPIRTFLAKPEVLSRIQTMVSTLRRLNIPIRLSIGDRTNISPSSGLDGSLYFGDYKAFVGEDENKHEVLLPTQASFNLTPIASMVDELTIQYPIDVPGVSGFYRQGKRPTPAEKALMQREMIGWRRFWTRYASQFTNLKKLIANVPNDIYDDWGKSELAELLRDDQWQMLEVQENNADFSSMSCYPYSSASLKYSFARKRRGSKFVQRVFFRLKPGPLSLTPSNPGITELEKEECEISDSLIGDVDRGAHRFWACAEQKDKNVKRKRKVNADDDVEEASKRIKKTGDTSEDTKVAEQREAAKRDTRARLDRLMEQLRGGDF